jgi:DNA-binding NarL/FixJ family response regulator
MVLEQPSDLQVVGDLNDGHHLISCIDRTHADVVVIDPDHLGSLASVTIAEIVSPRRVARTSVLVLTGSAEMRAVLAVLRAGARGVLLKGCPPEELVSGVRAVAAGEAVLAAPITGALLSRICHFLPLVDEGVGIEEALTKREGQILRMIATGRSNTAVARALGISNATVRSHVHHLLTKLNLTDRTQAVAHAYRTGFISAAHPGPVDSRGRRDT